MVCSRWGKKKSNEAISDPTAKAPPQRAAATGGGGGRTSGAAAKMPAVVAKVPEPPLLVDAIGWLPFTLAAAHMPGLLLELAHCGAYASLRICAGVSRACCSLDADTAGRFVLRLSESFLGEPTLPKTGGGGPGIRSSRVDGNFSKAVTKG